MPFYKVEYEAVISRRFEVYVEDTSRFEAECNVEDIVFESVVDEEKRLGYTDSAVTVEAFAEEQE